MLNIVTIFGTRPEAIKVAPVVKALENTPGIRSRVVVTGQHRQMLDQVLSLFEIKPHADLNIMIPDQTLFQITTRSLLGLEALLKKEKPHLVLVQGDTTTAFASALAAFYHQIPIGHIEAGLRTEDKYNPFPEEMNRRLITVLADLHFAPTRWAKANLLKSGVPESKIFLTGNTVTDALLSIQKKAEAFAHPILKSFNHKAKILLVEAHRRENLGKPMENICEALAKLAKDFQDLHLVFSVHKNPRVRETVFKKLKDKERIHLVEPMDYPTLVHLQSRAYLILTDSGGIQEEAPSLGKPVLVMRKTTERPEGIKAGVAKLVGTDAKKIYEETAWLLKNKRAYETMSKKANPYGDGKAAQRIVQAILYFFEKRKKPPTPFQG
jgi:UDP-N-acetylglucosamine 2-epimerase (non-hydrolysing)